MISQEAEEARKAAAAYEKQKPGSYESPYQQAIDGLLREMDNRGSFSYDPGSDPVCGKTANAVNAVVSVAPGLTANTAYVTSGNPSGYIDLNADL